MWPMLMEAIPRHMIAHQDKNDLSVTLKGFNSTIHLCGADNPDSLRGITINFLVADEIQDIPLEVIDMILRPAMGTTMADGIYIGTPKGKGNNTAYQLYLRGKTLPDWKSWHFTTEEGGNVPREEIESARQTMTKKQFDQEYLACHPEYNEILMADGTFKKIADCSVGDMVMYSGGSCEILKHGITGCQPINEIILETGELLKVSSSHKFEVIKDYEE